MAETHQLTKNGVEILPKTTAEMVMVGSRQLSAVLSGLQELLISGSNIKTINNESILGVGDLSIDIEKCKVIEVDSVGFYVCDKNKNIIMKFDSNGFDVAYVSQHFKDLLT